MFLFHVLMWEWHFLLHLAAFWTFYVSTGCVQGLFSATLFNTKSYCYLLETLCLFISHSTYIIWTLKVTLALGPISSAQPYECERNQKQLSEFINISKRAWFGRSLTTSFIGLDVFFCFCDWCISQVRDNWTEWGFVYLPLSLLSWKQKPCQFNCCSQGIVYIVIVCAARCCTVIERKPSWLSVLLLALQEC